MSFLIRTIMIYVAVALALVGAFRGDTLAYLYEMYEGATESLRLFWMLGWWTLPFAAAAMVYVGRSEAARRLPEAISAILFCTLFFVAFTMVKTSLPHIVPFWADPYFAALGRALHFGHDAWQLAHGLIPRISLGTAEGLYTSAWLLPAMYLPVLLVVFDADPDRRLRYFKLYLFCWIVLGTVLALAFSSVGPIYYDRLLGTQRFAALHQALEQVDTDTESLTAMQDWLWSVYREGGQSAGSGISAFPSVHVGMATVFAFYIGERWRQAWPLAVLIVVAFEFLSVYLGWHYAIDGYASILLISGAWFWLRRPALRRVAMVALPAQAR